MNGFLKQLYSHNDDYSIPDLVLTICLLYYYQREYFDTIIDGYETRGANFKLSNDRQTISLVDGCYGNAFGNVVVDSLRQIILKWTIKVFQTIPKCTSFNNVQAMGLGVSGDKPSDNLQSFYSPLSANTFFYGRGRARSGTEICVNNANVGWKWRTDDIVDIKLDLKARNIEYFVNGESKGIVFKNIPIGENIKYGFMIYMGNNGQSATIMTLQFI